jgi:hypothetical protein
MDDLDLLTFETVTIDGRPYTQWSNGRVLPVIHGGAGEGDSGAAAGDGDGAGAGAGAAAGSGTEGEGAAAGDGSDKGAAAGDGDQAKQVTMSQAEFDALIDKRLAKARKSWDDEAKTKADRDKLDETERLKAEKADAEKQAADRTATAHKRIARTEAKAAAIAAGVNEDRVERFLRNVDLDGDLVNDEGEPDLKAIRKAVGDALREVPEFKTPAKQGGGRSGGEFNGGQGGNARATTIEDAVNKRMANA